MASLVDPNPERRRHLAQLLHKFLSGKITVSDLDGIPQKKLRQVAETGYVKLKHGRFGEAREIFETLISMDHLNAYYRMALGAVFQKEGRLGEAVGQYTQALRLKTGDVASLVNRGEIFLRTKIFKKAADDFRQAILSDPDGANLWANRARSLVIALKRSLDLRKQTGATKSGRPQGAAPTLHSPPRPRSRTS